MLQTQTTKLAVWPAVMPDDAESDSVRTHSWGVTGLGGVVIRETVGVGVGVGGALEEVLGLGVGLAAGDDVLLADGDGVALSPDVGAGLPDGDGAGLADGDGVAVSLGETEELSDGDGVDALCTNTAVSTTVLGAAAHTVLALANGTIAAPADSD